MMIHHIQLSNNSALGEASEAETDNFAVAPMDVCTSFQMSNMHYSGVLREAESIQKTEHL